MCTYESGPAIVGPLFYMTRENQTHFTIALLARQSGLRENEVRLLQKSLVACGKAMLKGASAPLPLYRFARSVAASMNLSRAIPTLQLCDALKSLLVAMDDESIRILSPTDLPGVGYVYDQANSETWPIRDR